jgi:hypothetical protein
LFLLAELKNRALNVPSNISNPKAATPGLAADRRLSWNSTRLGLMFSRVPHSNWKPLDTLGFDDALVVESEGSYPCTLHRIVHVGS